MNGVVIQGLDVIDVCRFISKKNRKFEAIFLNELEEILKDHPEEFTRVRKLYLDDHNSYTKSVIRAIFGDSIEISV